MMLRVILTCDYEIHGNGDGSPLRLMVEPTARMLELFEPFGAKLTVMADVAEILRFREYRDATGRDEFGYAAIEAQLRRLVATGHDVQLHIHPSYERAEWHHGRWEQDYASYDITRLGFARIQSLVRRGKAYLEEVLRPARADYACTVFRAANWSMQPSPDIVRALIENGIRIDTSVFKYGRREGLVRFDYTGAWSDLIPWPAAARDICVREVNSPLVEVPIYAERRWLGAFATPQRVYRAILSRMHPLGAGALRSHAPRSQGEGGQRSLLRRIRHALGRQAWKMDFNQCTGRQLVAGLERAEAKAANAHGAACDVPLVLIGHSKLFNAANARSLRPFLAFVRDHSDRFSFQTFEHLSLDAIIAAFHASSRVVPRD